MGGVSSALKVSVTLPSVTSLPDLVASDTGRERLPSQPRRERSLPLKLALPGETGQPATAHSRHWPGTPLKLCSLRMAHQNNFSLGARSVNSGVCSIIWESRGKKFSTPIPNHARLARYADGYLKGRLWAHNEALPRASETRCQFTRAVPPPKAGVRLCAVHWCALHRIQSECSVCDVLTPKVLPICPPRGVASSGGGVHGRRPPPTPTNSAGWM